MKVAIVNCFDTYEDRVDLVYEFFKDKGYEVTIIQSNFRHFKKVHREDEKEDFIFIKSNPYHKNLSLTRLLSHYKYASDAFKIVEDIKPDLLYVFVPPNSLAEFAAKYKQKNKSVKLILDLIDLWPETMPIGKVKNFFPFTLWGTIRDRSLKHADLVITECDLYQSVLGETLKSIKNETVYLAKKDIEVTSNPKVSEDQIHLAYLGSINNIINIQKIKEVIQILVKVKPVILHIIGDGESKEELIDKAKSAGAIVEYHGKIYDPQEKQDIFDRCHYGLNIMKENVCVGLTMKSIDYFQHGLPIINNIPADTTKFLDEYGIGINITDGKDLDEGFLEVLNISSKSRLTDGNKTLKLFKEHFSIEAYFKKSESVFKEHLNI